MGAPSSLSHRRRAHFARLISELARIGCAGANLLVLAVWETRSKVAASVAKSGLLDIYATTQKYIYCYKVEEVIGQYQRGSKPSTGSESIS